MYRTEWAARAGYEAAMSEFVPIWRFWQWNFDDDNAPGSSPVPPWSDQLARFWLGYENVYENMFIQIDNFDNVRNRPLEFDFEYTFGERIAQGSRPGSCSNRQQLGDSSVFLQELYIFRLKTQIKTSIYTRNTQERIRKVSRGVSVA